jgi:small subunit ribosomal protein S21
MDQYPPPPFEPGHPLARDGHEPVILKPIEVVVADGKLEKALRKLKKKMATEGVLKELKRRRRATKPSDAKRRKRLDAARRRRKRERAAAKRK